MDDSDAGFEVEIAPTSVGNVRDYYVTVTDFTKLTENMVYNITVSIHLVKFIARNVPKVNYLV